MLLSQLGMFTCFVITEKRMNKIGMIRMFLNIDENWKKILKKIVTFSCVSSFLLLNGCGGKPELSNQASASEDLDSQQLVIETEYGDVSDYNYTEGQITLSINTIIAKNRKIYKTESTVIYLDELPDDDYETYFDGILQELSGLLGYQLVYTDVTADADSICIDFTEDSAPFAEEATINEDSIVFDGYEEMVYSIFDSIALTLKANDTKQRAIYFKLNGDDFKLDLSNQTVIFSSQEAYIPKVEEKIIDEGMHQEVNPLSLKLGMSREEVDTWFLGQGIFYDVWFENSHLGNFSDADTYKNVEELCKDSYEETLYLADDFMVIFDGEDGTLTSVVLQSKEYTTAKGLSLVNNKQDMENLYGMNYTIYDDSECSLYEYMLENGYFVVCIDDLSEEIIYIKKDAFSQAEYLVGINLLNELIEKELNY